MELDPDDLEPRELYRLVTSTVVPRPIGWISTRTADGVDNLAPYSYFNAVSSIPPVVMFSAGRRDDRPKDTARNAIDAEEFVYNLVTEELAAAMDETSASLPPDESEFDAAGIERAEAVTVDAARVRDAKVCFECSLYDSLSVHRNTLVFGAVEFIHVDESVLTDGKIDTRKVDAVGRLGGPFYTAIDIMDLRRQY